jgi:hypothetical protein
VGEIFAEFFEMFAGQSIVALSHVRTAGHDLEILSDSPFVRLSWVPEWGLPLNAPARAHCQRRRFGVQISAKETRRWGHGGRRCGEHSFMRRVVRRNIGILRLRMIVLRTIIARSE